MQEEEEKMTGYKSEELADGWEFKILRANTMAFRDPQVLSQVCAEEAQSGWVLLEKFDDARLRFKRPRGSSAGPTIDPYRCHYGMSPGRYIGLVLVMAILGVTAVIGVLAIGRATYLHH
jgi:hypothetical protein